MNGCFCNVPLPSSAAVATSIVRAVGASMGPAVVSRLVNVVGPLIVASFVSPISALLVVVGFISVTHCHDILQNCLEMH